METGEKLKGNKTVIAGGGVGIRKGNADLCTGKGKALKPEQDRRLKNTAVEALSDRLNTKKPKQGFMRFPS